MEPQDPRLNRFLDRAAPALRNVEAAISRNGELRAARDSIADRVADMAQQAADAIKGVGSSDMVEGEVLGEQAEATDPDRSAVAPSTPPTRAFSSTPAAAREAHWTRARMARVAVAAGREAVRPAEPLVPARAVRIGIATLLGLLLAWQVVRLGRR